MISHHDSFDYYYFLFDDSRDSQKFLEVLK